MTNTTNTHGLLESFGAENILELNRFGISTLTHGAFGHISLALLHRSNCKSELVAIKSIQGAVSPDNKLQLDVFHEVSALRELQTNNRHHPNIVKLLALYAKDKTSISLAFEYCPVDLSLALQWRRRRRKPPRLLAVEIIRTIAQDLFEALCFCHGKGIVHCDIKPGNILVSNDGFIRLCDFGLARPMAERAEGDSRGVCTLFYRSPESLLGDTQNRRPALDIFAAGLVVAELCLGRTLWEGTNEMDQLGFIFRSLGTPGEKHWPNALQLVEKYHYGRLPFAKTIPLCWSVLMPRVTESSFMEEFFVSTIALDPDKRISAKDALKQKWLSSEAIAERACLLCELVPNELDIPFFVSSNEAVSSIKSEVAIRQILGLANRRRTFLSRFETWGET